MTASDITPEQQEALDVAARMIDAGIPVFAAPPCPAAHGGNCDRPGHTGKEEYDLPGKWQLTVPSKVNLEKWRQGWALGAVGGHRADFLDEDPRNGGADSIEELMRAGHMPRVFGVQSTPSGGQHYMISPLGERETNGFLPGLDYQGGTPDGQGRAFVWIAPTTRRSKVTGVVSPYRWEQLPDLDYLAEFDGGDDSVEELRARILARRTKPERQNDNREAREFTEEQARLFCDLTIKPLTEAQIGEIEERANAAAVQLSHFVPDFWSADFAYAVLTAALSNTAYDPDHPASTWTADKFRDVIAGVNRRAPGDWKAVRVAEAVQEVQPEPDEVDALIAEMLSPGQVEDIPAPRHLIRGVLTLDSEVWTVGAPGSKKSFMVLDQAACVSLGRPWQGRETVQGPVVFIVAEGASGTGKRVKAWQKEYGQMGEVHFLPRPVQAKNMKAWATLVEACRRLKPVMVVLDTQARMTVGLEENSATDMGMYVEAVRAIREATGACVDSIHHTGRKGQDARGSSALDGAQSTELTVVAGDTPLSATIKITKQKDLDIAEDIPLRFKIVDLGVNEFGEPVTSLVLLPPDAWEAASGVAVADPGQGYTIAEPGEWTRLLAKPDAIIQQRILQTLLDVAGLTGRTESQVRKLVAERWHAGLEGRGQGRLNVQKFGQAWVRVIEMPQVMPGEAGPKSFILDPEWISRNVTQDVTGE